MKKKEERMEKQMAEVSFRKFLIAIILDVVLQNDSETNLNKSNRFNQNLFSQGRYLLRDWKWLELLWKSCQ